MDLGLDPELDAIQELFAGLMAKECSTRVVREAEPLGFSARLWEQLRQTDAPGMGLPTACGGGGLGLVALCIACEALGQALAPVPLVEHSVAARLLARLRPEHHRLGELASGATLAALALRPARAGRTGLVPGGSVAEVLLALDGEELVALASEPPGRGPQTSGGSALADRELAGERDVLASGSEARAAFEGALTEWRALTAAALVGVAQGAFDVGLDYVKEREQFGRPIGSFQAIQHGLADLVAPLSGARLLARKAAWALDAGMDEGAELAAMAFLFAGETAQSAASRSLHYHGGYGFSAEYDIQLYFRRAKAWVLALDDPSREYQKLADRRYGPRRPEPAIQEH